MLYSNHSYYICQACLAVGGAAEQVSRLLLDYDSLIFILVAADAPSAWRTSLCYMVVSSDDPESRPRAKKFFARETVEFFRRLDKC
jgi:hypothetical protein